MTPFLPLSLAQCQARVHELEQLLAAAHGSSQQLSALAYHTREGRLLLDAAGTVLLVNDQYCQLWDMPLPAAQWLGQPMSALVALAMARVADPAAYAAELAQAQVNPISQLNARLALRSGRVLERDVLSVPLGLATGWLLCYRDVTPQHLAAEQLRFVSRLPEENPSPILRLDAGGDRLYANAAARRLQQLLPYAAHAALYAELQEAAVEALCAQQPQQLAVQAADIRFQVAVVPVVAEGYVNLYLVDVTARHQAETQLAEQRQFYETILNELPAELFVIDPQARYQFVNPAAVPDAALREWMVGRTHAEYHAHRGLPDDLAQQRQALLNEVLTAGQPQEWVEALGTAATPRYVLRRLQPVPTDGEPVRLVIGYGLDVTERETTRRALREQQEFTQGILDATPSVIYVRDDQGRMRFENHAMQAVRAASRHLTGEAVAPHSVEARELAQYAANDQVVLRTGRELMVEEVLTQLDGTVRVFQTVKRPLTRPDGTVQVLAVSTDITAQKQARYTLERSEKQYRDLMHYAQALICTYDMAGTVLSVNPALAALLGRSVAGLLGQPVAAQLLAEDQDRFGDYLLRIAAEGEARGVLRVRPQGSAKVCYLLYHNVVMYEAGQEPYIISHAQDITERILAERETQRAREEAEATARARENFLANMSHEIRTPMNGVLGMTNQLAKTRLDPRQQELVRVIQSSGQHLLAVLNDVLDMAKITAGKLELEASTFNLCDSVAEALHPLIMQAQEKGLAFHGVALRESCPLPWVVADPHRLNQIMLNLVSNALKFTAQGSITVKSELLAETSQLLTVRFSVADTGAGIAPDKQALIFDSFTQAYAATTRQYGGTGLGLSISRALVEQMGGQLTLESALGRGSTFGFTLTLRKAEPVALAPAAPATGYNTGRLAGTRVLLVEDNEINRMVARMMLEPWGVQLEEAPDGITALALLADQDYDLVLMDIQMPGLSGLDVTQRLRQQPDPRRAATPAIALTANAFRADTERYLAAGFNDCLTKPYDEATLYRKMEALLPLPAALVPYDLSQLRLLAQGRDAFVAKIIRSFLANMPASLEQLRAAGARADWPEVARLVHHIQPNLLALGTAGIESALEILAPRHHRTSAGAKHAPAALQSALHELLTAVERVIQLLPAELPA